MTSRFQMLDNACWPQEPRIEWERVTLNDPVADPNDYLFQDPDYATEDQARLDAYQRGDWSFIGIRAKATVYVPIGGNSFATYELHSPGLWSIESDSDESYLASVYEDERAALRNALQAMGQAALAEN